MMAFAVAAVLLLIGVLGGQAVSERAAVRMQAGLQAMCQGGRPSVADPASLLCGVMTRQRSLIVAQGR